MNFLIQNNTFPLSGLYINSGIGGIYSNSTNDTKSTNFAVSPYIGKEISRKLFAGVQLDYRTEKYYTNGTSLLGPMVPVSFERNTNQIGFGVFTRHILYPDNKFSFFVQPYFKYNILNSKQLQDAKISEEEKANYVELGAGLGLLYNINSRMRATLRTGGVSYVNGKWEIKDTDTKKNFSSFGTNLSLSAIYFGFEIRV